ncbi:MAG: DUF3549 family protein [Pseudomonadota bacterium]
MSTISTLTEFLEATGSRLCYFDMGRRVNLIPRDAFIQFELTLEPYPLPLQQQAWLGILFLDQSTHQTEPLIWFIRFPLDEQGKLVLAARDEFLHRLIEAAEMNLKTADRKEKLQSALQDNPYVFRPKPERMANFHAKATLLLNQPASHYYEHAQEYFSGKLGWEQWSFLGYQGIADIAARQALDENTHILSSAIPHLPPTPLEALCHCLENEHIAGDISQALISRAEKALTTADPDPQILSACLRGFALSPSESPKQQLLHKILSHEISRRSDILAAISGRTWEVLLDEQIRDQYLASLADNDRGQDFFNNILSDLLFLPATRSTMLDSLRSQDRPKRLDAAIGEFFNQFQKH